MAFESEFAVVVDAERVVGVVAAWARLLQAQIRRSRNNGASPRMATSFKPLYRLLDMYDQGYYIIRNESRDEGIHFAEN